VDAPYTRDFDDLAAWLAQQINKTQITRLLRIGWASVGEIVARVVAGRGPLGRPGDARRRRDLTRRRSPLPDVRR
jgi:hypothetical protein